MELRGQGQVQGCEKGQVAVLVRITESGPEGWGLPPTVQPACWSQLSTLSATPQPPGARSPPAPRPSPGTHSPRRLLDWSGCSRNQPSSCWAAHSLWTLTTTWGVRQSQLLFLLGESLLGVPEHQWLVLGECPSGAVGGRGETGGGAGMEAGAARRSGALTLPKKSFRLTRSQSQASTHNASAAPSSRSNSNVSFQRG